MDDLAKVISGANRVLLRDYDKQKLQHHEVFILSSNDRR